MSLGFFGCLLQTEALTLDFDPVQNVLPIGLLKKSALDETCYVNAIVQMLRAIPELQTALARYVVVDPIEP